MLLGVRRSLAAIAAVVVFATPALAESFVNQHVKLKYSSTRRTVVGVITAEEEEFVTLKIGKGSTSTIDRADIESIESIEKTWLEIKKKQDAAKTGEDWYQVGLLLEKEGFDRGSIRECWDRAIKLDPNHANARKKAGFTARKNERGETVWLDKNKVKKFDETSGSIKATAEAMGDRPWDGADESGKPYKITVRKPDKQPEYEIITNCPEDVANEYANFMVDLKKQLVSLIEKQVGQRVTWQKNPCKQCGGSGGSCAHCGGKGQEPAKVFITNSHKFFMDITGSPEGLGGYYRPGYFPPGECERPIVTFHGQFGTGNTFMVLAHEGTHQLEHLMWKGDDSSLFRRPGWLTEGLAVFFGDGLDMSQRKQGIYKVDIPRDRLAGLRRQLNLGHGKYYPIRMFTSFGIPQYQQDPGLYAYGWSLIYFMLNHKEKFKFNGKEIDLKDAFGKFFIANCERGSIEEYPMRQDYSTGAWQSIAKAMGITDPREGAQALDELEKVWRDYILKLPLRSVVAQDPKDKKKFVSKDLQFEISLPGGKKKSKFDWQQMPEEDLVSTLLEEAAAFTVNKGEARAIVACMANAENVELDDAVELVRGRTKQRRFSEYKELTEDPIEGTLQGSPVEVRIIEFEGKERKFPGYVDNPRTSVQHGKMLICRTAARIYQVVIETDKDSWDTYKAELEEILQTFGVTG